MINASSFPIHFKDEGIKSGLPVILIHGFPFSLEMWHEQVRVLSSKYRVICYDVRGHGKSEVGDGQYSIESHVDDLLALMNFLKLTKAALLGFSMGGYIALRALEKFPDRFLALVLSDTRSAPDNDEAKLKRFSSMTFVKEKGSQAFSNDFISKIFSPESLKTKPEVFEPISSIIAATPPLSIAANLLAMASRTDTTPSLAKISIPTVIFVGEKDIITPVKDAQLLNDCIKGSELYIVPGAAHMSNLENSDFFNEHLLIFLKRVTFN